MTKTSEFATKYLDRLIEEATTERLQQIGAGARLLAAMFSRESAVSLPLRLLWPQMRRLFIMLFRPLQG